MKTYGYGPRQKRKKMSNTKRKIKRGYFVPEPQPEWPKYKHTSMDPDVFLIVNANDRGKKGQRRRLTRGSKRPIDRLHPEAGNWSNGHRNNKG